MAELLLGGCEDWAARWSWALEQGANLVSPLSYAAAYQFIVMRDVESLLWCFVDIVALIYFVL